MDILTKQKFHLTGIKGVGMTALALILKDMGKEVAGSDLPQQFLTDSILKQANISVKYGFSSKNIEEAEVIVYSGSHQGQQNIEVVSALKKNIPVISLSALLGLLSAKKESIAICGCHGKTTTTALAAYVGEQLRLRPSYYSGGPGFMNYSPGKWGKGKLFFVEADEYVVDPQKQKTAKFLSLKPKNIICTTIDYDHPDVFSSPEALAKSYATFFHNIDESGNLIINGDDRALVELVKKNKLDYITYGFHPNNDFHIVSKQGHYELFQKQQKIAQIKPNLVGKHNMANITAILVLYEVLGYDLNSVVPMVESFTGVKRRMEELSRVDQAIIVDDYAHHPEEIKATLIALREKYPHYPIALCFQPHTYSRTQTFFNSFVSVLNQADYIGLLPIFASAREKLIPGIDHYAIIQALKSKYQRSAYSLENTADWERFVNLSQKKTRQCLYITMGAGDVYLKAKLIKTLLTNARK